MTDEIEVFDDEAKRATLAAAIVAGRSYGDIAADLDVHRNTITRWRQQPEVVAAVSFARTEVLTNVIGALTTTALESVTTLEEIRDDPDASNADRIRAAVALLTEMRHAHSQIEHEQRISDLEDAAARIADQKKALEP